MVYIFDFQLGFYDFIALLYDLELLVAVLDPFGLLFIVFVVLNVLAQEVCWVSFVHPCVSFL